MAIQSQSEFGVVHSPVNAMNALAHAALWAIARGVATFNDWRAQRQLGGLDDSMLKDFGISRSNIDWSVRHGRDGM